MSRGNWGLRPGDPPLVAAKVTWDEFTAVEAARRAGETRSACVRRPAPPLASEGDAACG